MWFLMMIPEKNAVLAAMYARGYAVFTRGDYNLNIIGVRSGDRRSNAFDDFICLYYKVAGREYFHAFKATTDPGVYWRRKPMNVHGTAILLSGQYHGLWKLGKHRGKYAALVQAKPVRVWRDNNRNDVLDVSWVDEGLFGINLHRANPIRTSLWVDKWSAGCQVLANPLHFMKLMKLAKRSARRYGNSFTYTLLNEADVWGH